MHANRKEGLIEFIGRQSRQSNNNNNGLGILHELCQQGRRGDLTANN